MANTERTKNKKTNKSVDNNAPAYVNSKEYFASAKFDNNSISRSTARSVGVGSDQLKSGFNRWDYYGWRPEDNLPTWNADIILSAQNFYRRIGLVRNVIDLMTDFAAEGIAFNHPVKSQERFYREWARRVNIQDRVNNYMKLLLRDGNVIVRRKLAKIPKKVAQDFAKAFMNEASNLGPTVIDRDVPGIRNTKEDTSSESPDDIQRIKPNQDPKAKKNVIPWKYTFLNPVFIEKIGGRVGRFVGADDLGVRLSKRLIKAIREPRTETESGLKKQLPQEVIQAAMSNAAETKIIRLDMERIYVDYYKKDDWEDWATPFLYGVFEDLMYKDKLKLADIAALDGVINSVRLWKLGDHGKDIFPNPAATNKLLDILSVSTGGGMTDIVWDSMIDVETVYPPIQDILGPEKYIAVETDIVRGLGIPDSLLGGAELSTRNAETAFIQLKTLIERLEYIRSRCIDWLNVELRLVADAMGFKKIPSIAFETMSLRDEAAEKDLIIRLAERNLISTQAVHDVFDFDTRIEQGRMKDEQKFRENNPAVMEKANPYYRPQSQLILQNELKKDEETHRANLEVRNAEINPDGSTMKGDQPRDVGDNPVGRPPGSKDQTERDRRTPRVLSVYKVQAEKIISNIDTIIDPLYLKDHKAKNMRFLTAEQKRELEHIKRSLLATVGSGELITKQTLHDNTSNVSMLSEFNVIFSQLVEAYTEINGKMPNLSERRSLSASAWALMRGE